MINIPERENDIYVNALIHILSRDRNLEPAFDLDAFRELCRIVASEVEDRLSSLFFNADPKRKTVNLVEAFFIQGWEHERGLHGSVDFEAAAQLYSWAIAMGHDESRFRLAWLIENELVSDYGDADQLYQKAADHGHVKSLIACGQRSLFQAVDEQDLRESLKLYEMANSIEPMMDYLYIGPINELVEEARQGADVEIADHLEHIVPLIGHLKQGESVHYQRDAESNIRLAKFLHHHHKRMGTFFLSWCYMNGVGLPKDRELGMQLAYQVYTRHNAISNYYMAWVHLMFESVHHHGIGIQFLKSAAMGGLNVAIEDWDILKSLAFSEKINKLTLHKPDNEILNMEKWFDLRKGR